MAYPATFDVETPEEFDKAQVVLRIVIVVVLGWLLDAVFSAAYLLLPIIAAILISQKGAEQYLAEAEAGPTKWLRYLMGFFSYLALATDKLPTGAPEEVIEFQVQTTGSPTVGSALIRLILAIPHVIVLSLLGIILAICWLVAAIAILINTTYPDWAKNFILGYLRWTARVMVYMASLVDEYPPFSFQNGAGENGGSAASEAGGAEPPAETPALQEGSDEGTEPND